MLLRRQALRRGPGTNHAVVDMADREMEFLVLGKSLNGDWWQVSYEGRPVWISALYADDFNTENIRIAATPTPLPSPTVVDTATPVPTPTMERLSDELWDILKEVVESDIVDMGREPDEYTEMKMGEWAGELYTVLKQASEKCEMPIVEILDYVEQQAQRVAESGKPEKYKFWTRYAMIGRMVEESKGNATECKAYLVGWSTWVINDYEGE